MVAGTSTVAPGTMARAIYDAIVAEFGAVTGQEDADRKRTCAAVAQGVVAHLASFADVRVKTTDVALQRAGGVDTDGPAADRVLSGALE